MSLAGGQLADFGQMILPVVRRFSPPCVSLFYLQAAVRRSCALPEEKDQAMTQAELNRAVAYATGETVKTIADMGFGPLRPIPIERDPLVVDWDDLDAQRRIPVFPQRRRPEFVSA
jgi:hypothetical protein